MYVNYYSIYRKFIMFQSFITSLDNNESNIKSKRQQCLPSNTKENRLRQQIKDIIASMINSKEICTQAALNIGLSTTLLDFDKLTKSINNETNLSTLAFTFMQLKTLQKQANKLKNSINTPKETPKTNLRNINRQVTQNPVREEPTKNQVNSQQKIAKALQQELAFRIKVRQLNSRQKISRKQQILKKRVEKAKSMNKRAFKIYKNHKQQQSKAYDFFKMQPTPSNLSSKNLGHQPILTLDEKDQILALNEQSYEIKEKTTCKMLNISIMRESFTAPEIKSKNATKMRLMMMDNDSSLISNKQRFVEQKRRQLEVRNNKLQLQKSKEEQALFRLIKKQEKLSQIEHTLHEESSTRLLKKTHKIKQNEENFSKMEEDQLQLDSAIKSKCEQKALQKQLHLQEQVNRIRQQRKIKQERQQRHKLEKQRQHQQKMQLNQAYLKEYNNRCKKLKENELKHEMTIKQRREESKQRQVFTKIVNNLSKYTDKQLIKSIKKLKNINHSQSLFGLNNN